MPIITERSGYKKSGVKNIFAFHLHFSVKPNIWLKSMRFPRICVRFPNGESWFPTLSMQFPTGESRFPKPKLEKINRKLRIWSQSLRIWKAKLKGQTLRLRIKELMSNLRVRIFSGFRFLFNTGEFFSWQKRHSGIKNKWWI